MFKDHSKWLYDTIGPVAHTIKVILQMLIGLAVAGCVAGQSVEFVAQKWSRSFA